MGAQPLSTAREGRLLLAVETATRVTSVALLRGDRVIAEIAHDGGGTAERLLPAIDALLARAGCRLDAVEAFAVSIGPGSFTGVRVGVATVKGLAFDSALPIAPVSTLAALAAGAHREGGPLVALLDARRGEVYAGIFAQPGQDLEPQGGERVYTAEELAAVLPRPCRLLVGEDAGAVAAAVVERLGGAVQRLPEPGLARAALVGRLGARALARGAGVAADALRPRYVRRAEAEVRRTGQRFEAL